ncbi:MAG: WYL domain-containing protein [Marinospirillum sp.]|uniref:transcriptional regulator n=1 Tax=Marinospirillum sp. TaxID=2183934 RepID=UPI0019DBF8C4|nr:WYL domain-containing protein [Marinospirillum sp.]MBE0507397.1 WYL domain-containing protein [Marinospirillum sp.]
MSSIRSVTSSSQKERLWHIDFLARFRGFVTRQDLVDRFQIALSNATRDLTLYRDLVPENLEYSTSDKSYRRTPRFAPLFTYDHEHTLQALAQGQARGFDPFEQTVVVESARNLNEPDLEILSQLSRAIYSGYAVEIKYVSASSGAGHRVIIPHALANTGLRWHLRAFCREKQEFRDFVLTRFLSVSQQTSDVAEHEKPKADTEWQQQVELELIPHPKAAHKQAIELDYGLASGEHLTLEVRAALVGYLLRRWGVDASEGACLSPEAYQLYLSNRSTLLSVSSMALAPGFIRDGVSL